MLHKCERGNKIAPHWHKCWAKRGMPAEEAKSQYIALIADFRILWNSLLCNYKRVHQKLFVGEKIGESFLEKNSTEFTHQKSSETHSLFFVAVFLLWQEKKNIRNCIAIWTEFWRIAKKSENEMKNLNVWKMSNERKMKYIICSGETGDMVSESTNTKFPNCSQFVNIKLLTSRTM